MKTKFKLRTGDGVILTIEAESAVQACTLLGIKLIVGAPFCALVQLQNGHLAILEWA